MSEVNQQPKPAQQKMPKIRFEGFSEDWKTERLSDICSHFQSGQGITSLNIFKTGKYPVYGGNGLRGYTDSYSHEGDFVLIGRQGALCGNIHFVTGENYISEHAIAVQANVENDTFWLGFWLYKKDLGRLSESSAQPGLAVNKLVRLKVIAPDKTEQAKISNLLQELDKLIELQTRAVESAETYKKAMLQKMFPQKGEKAPKVRFEGFHDDWGKKILSEIVHQIRSYSLSRSVETEENTGLKYIHYGDIHLGTAAYLSSDESLSFINSDTEYILLQCGDLVLADASEDYIGVAEPCVIDFEPKNKLVAGLHTIALRPDHSQSSSFLYYYFKTKLFKKHCYRVGTGMKVLGITYNNLSKYEGYVPSLEEQTHIGNYFQELDRNIETEKQKLEQYQTMKRAMLQRMFV